MKDNKETLNEFESTAKNLLQSLKSFSPQMESIRKMAEVDISDADKEVVDQFNVDAKNLDVEGLKRLKEEYLKKLKNGK